MRLSACSTSCCVFPLLIDPILGSGVKSGYNFVGERGFGTPNVTPPSFYFTARPSTPSGLGRTGTRRFGIETSGVMVVDQTFASLGTYLTYADILTCQSAPAACGPLTSN